MQRATLVLTVLLTLPTPEWVQAPPPRSNPEAERAHLHYRLGWESLRSEAWADAVKEFQQAIDIDSRFKLAYYGLGRSYMGLHQFQPAAKAYDACRGLYAKEASEKFANQLDADKTRQDDQLQLQIAIQSMSRLPQNQQTQNQIQQLKNQSQRIQMKRDATRDLSLESYVPAFVSLALGSAYFRSERFTDAEREYKAALEADPKAGEAHNNLAVVYMLTGRFDESSKEIVLAEKAGFKVNPELKKDLADKTHQRH